MEYAVIKTGGKQYKVSQGTVLDVDKLDNENKNLIFTDVLLFVGDGQIKIGKPSLNDVQVKAEILDNFKGEKIRVAKFKAKARYRRVSGFRAQLSRLQINEIVMIKKNSKDKSAQPVLKKKKKLSSKKAAKSA